MSYICISYLFSNRTNMRKGISYKIQTTFVYITMSFKEKLIYIERWKIKTSNAHSIIKSTLSSDGLWWVTLLLPGMGHLCSLTLWQLSKCLTLSRCSKSIHGLAQKECTEWEHVRGGQGPAFWEQLEKEREKEEMRLWKRRGQADR